MKKIILVLMLICIVGCVNEIESVDQVEDVDVIDQPIGGQKDEHGCLGPAGYSYDSEIGACTRNWELNESQSKAAKIVVDYLGKEGTVTKVDVMRCPGCFIVEMKMHDDSLAKVNLENWEIIELSPEECESRNGKSVNTVGGASCEKGETNIGKVVGFISPNICCVKE